ncbi:acyltransferase [Conidiobolus coronatus NRRL 28638]|uniref:1-acyl-sn-glycerol-3-phosphate acyltransferase n=1 Tax=Conidiobolus coronatus (strain ATCC 28846 / CBS 209.66 / NRRL 28638) TaxID=796925 RepID=A0A137P5F6_CONC2|nr:acyltransferase [Conidiobolus coronatus NRRL 28638]|eukprot:KXN70250.1 acyltransferase [Conidiobolus coronatus NRRL 28638]
MVFFSTYKLVPTVRFYTKGVLIFIFLSIASVSGIFLGVIFGSLEKLEILTLTLVTFSLGISFEILNEDLVKKLEVEKPCIYLCNHQTMLDLAIMGTHFPLNTCMMVKKSLKYVPFLGLYLLTSQIAFIERSNIKNAIETTQKLAKDMKDKNMGVWIYVEGTRSEFTKADLLPFKKGPFHLAVETGYPIVPVVFSNSSKVFSMKRKVCESGHIKIKFLDPISTEGKTRDDIPELMEKTREVMMTNLIEISK